MEEATITFEELKKAFIIAPILQTFDLEKHIIIKIDISDYAIRACIS